MDILSYENNHLSTLRQEINLQLANIEKQLCSSHQNIVAEKERFHKEFSLSIFKPEKNINNAIQAQLIQQMQNSRTHLVRQRKILHQLNKKPFFAKITMEETKDDIEEFYIGINTLSDKKTHDLKILDWRAPICSVYYQNKCGVCSYASPEGTVQTNLLQKRQFFYEESVIVDYVDNTESFHDYALINYITSKQGSQLKQVVATIQGKQDQLIRKKLTRDTIIEGPAGSGKTIIAYHRLAHQLYKYKDSPTISNRFFMIGPSKKYFSHTLSVLDELGEDAIPHTTLKELYQHITESYYLHQVKDMHPLNIHHEQLPSLSEADDFYSSTIHGLSFSDITFFKQLIMTKEEIKQYFINHISTPYTLNLSAFLDLLRNRLLKMRERIFQLVLDEFVNLDDHPFDAKAYSRLLMIREQKKLFDKIRESYTLSYDLVVDKFINHCKISTRLNLDSVYVYFYMRIHQTKQWRPCRELLIDEAQDLTHYDIYNIKQVFPNAILLMFGDRYQSKVHSIESTIFSTINADIFRLNESYRSTKEIVDFSNAIINENTIQALPRSGPKVALIHGNQDDLSSLISQDHHEKLLILFDDIHHQIDIDHVDVLPVFQTNGLEYSQVYVYLENENILSNNILKQSLYVAVTRALHSLTIITPHKNLLQEFAKFI